MFGILLKFSIGLGILLLSTQKFVELAKKVSRIFRISPLIVGITVVAIGTSLPELTVSLVSVLKRDTGLAIGNIVGSNIVNVLLVFPVGLFIGKLRIGTTKTQRNALLLLGVTAIFFFTQIIGTVKITSGLFLIGLAVAISVMEYQLAIFGRTHEDIKQFKTSKNGKVRLSMFFYGFILILGIIYGGLLVVDSVEMIASVTGISTTILGLTLTAVATSLPELFTTIFSQGNDQEKITVGNILGSNIYNLLLVGGVISLFPLTAAVGDKEWLWLAAATLGFVAVLRFYTGRRPPKLVGVVFLLLFVIYLITQG